MIVPKYGPLLGVSFIAISAMHTSPRCQNTNHNMGTDWPAYAPEGVHSHTNTTRVNHAECDTNV